MMFDLVPRERRELAPGAVHVPDWLDVPAQRSLVRHCRRWAVEGPGIRAAALPNGARTSVRTVCLGRHWIPYRYSRTRDDQDGSPVTPFPAWLGDLGRDAVGHAYADPARATGYHPDVALINHYTDDARLGMHRDGDELGAGRLNITLRVSGLQPDDRRRGSAVQNERRRGIP